MKSIAYLCLMAAAAFCGYAPNPYYDSIPDKSWRQIPATRMTDVASSMFYTGGNSGFGIFAYSGAVKDTMNGRIIFWGGGHGDYYGNEIYQFKLDSLKWKRVTDPSPYSATHCTDRVHTFPDSTPKSRHTYDQMCYVYHRDRFWGHGGSICGPGSGIKDKWELDLTARKWKDLDPAYVWSWNMNLGLSCEYDVVARKIYYYNLGTIVAFNPDDNTSTNLVSTSFAGTECVSVLDPDSRKIVTYGGYTDTNSNKVLLFSIDSGKAETRTVPPRVPASRGPGWAFDSRNGFFLTYGGYENTGAGKPVWYYDARSDVWFPENIPGGPDGGQFHYERFVYDDINQVTLFFRTPYENVWVFKNRNPAPSGVNVRKIAQRMAGLSVRPNPCRTGASVVFRTFSGGSAAIFSPQGHLIREFTAGAGPAKIIWDGRNSAGAPVPTGVYLVRVKADGKQYVRNLALVR